MALIAVASGKGSPGTTTLALTLATVWPRPAVLAELDPVGTDLAYRLRGSDGEALAAERGVLGLAADPHSPLTDHVQQITSGLDVLVGPPPAGLSDPVGRWAEVGGALAGAPGLDVVADCGRLHAGSPALPVLRAAAGVVLVTRPTIDNVAHLLATAGDVVDAAPAAEVHVVVVADVRDDRSWREIAGLVEQAELPVGVVRRFAHDRDAVGLLSGAWSARLHRSLLVRSGREIATELANAVTAPQDLRVR